MTIRPNLAFAAAAAGLLLAGAAQAQGVLTPGAMPPPPSFQETTKAEGRAEKRRARKPAQAEADVAADGQAATPRRKLRANTGGSTGQNGSLSSRVDDRPQRAPSGGMQLEDDPRAVTPVLNNGRAGVGMRF